MLRRCRVAFGGPKGSTMGLAAVVIAAVVAAAVGGGRAARANTNDPVLSGNSGTTGNANLAEDATEIQYDGGPAPGVVFLSQADSTYTPAQAGYPAALGGWTSTNSNVPNGIYGYSEVDGGNGLVGVGTGPARRAGLFVGQVGVYNGNVFVAHPNSLIITSPNGACWQIRVGDTGAVGAGPVGCP